MSHFLLPLVCSSTKWGLEFLFTMPPCLQIRQWNDALRAVPGGAGSNDLHRFLFLSFFGRNSQGHDPGNRPRDPVVKCVCTCVLMHRTLGHIVGAKLMFGFLSLLLGSSPDAERALGRCQEAWILTLGLPQIDFTLPCPLPK